MSLCRFLVILSHFAVGDTEAREKNVLALIKAFPGSILAKDKKGLTPMDVAKKVEVSVEVYEILRKCYKQQSRSEEQNVLEKTHKTKKKKKNDSGCNDSVPMNEKDTNQDKFRKKREKIGLHDSVSVLNPKEESDSHGSFKRSRNVNDVDEDKHDEPNNAFQFSSKPKKKKPQYKTLLVDDGKRKGSVKSAGTSIRSKPKEDNKGGERHKSLKMLVEDEPDKNLPRISSKRDSKSGKASEGMNAFAKPKSRKGNVSAKSTPKSPKALSLLDIPSHAVKTSRSFKNKKDLKTNSPPCSVSEKRKRSKTSKSSSKIEVIA
jgi:hypothetical protein